MADPQISSSFPVSQQAVRMLQKEVAAENAMQVESEEDMNQYFELSIFNPMRMAKEFKNFKDLKSEKKAEANQATEDRKILEVEKVDEAAARFQRNNDELNAKTLLILRGQIKASDTPDEALQKVLAVYPDAALADEALDFLIETADPETKPILQAAKEELNRTRATEIRAGRNMGAQAREFSKEGLGSPTSLREMYVDITGNPREPLKLFEELTEKFRYAKLRPILTFMLHSLGSDLKSKGPSIARGELKRLFDEVRSLQGILGIFRFFQSRMRLMQREFASYNLLLPPRLDFEAIARAFVKILAERYMNADKITQTAKLLGVSEEIAAQIIIYSQMRDALKQIAPRYYRNTQHRDELTKAFIEAIEKLEDALEEEEENEEGKEESEEDDDKK